jgi:hypothetical protein
MPTGVHHERLRRFYSLLKLQAPVDATGSAGELITLRSRTAPSVAPYRGRSRRCPGEYDHRHPVACHDRPAADGAEVVEFTDPVCPWAWGSEPVFRRLRAALAWQVR